MTLPAVASLVLAPVSSAPSIPFSFDLGLLRPVQFKVGRHRIFRDRQLRVRNAVGKINKEGAVLVLLDPADRLLRELIVAVGSLVRNVLTIDPQVVIVRVEHFLVIAPEKFWIIEMGKALVVKSQAMVKALVVRTAGMSGSADSIGMGDISVRLVAGRAADLLVVIGDPSRDLKALWNVVDVYQDGARVERGVL